MIEHLQNLHTHTIFCDGRDTVEEMVLSAIQKGFSSIGFSGHSAMPFVPDYPVTLESTEQYKKEVHRIKEAYKGQLDVFLGLELEKYSRVPLDGYDYLIGSVHYLPIGEALIGIDRNLETVRSVINTYFGGDGMKYARAYYEEVAALHEVAKLDILGHFDLLTKHMEHADLFDVESKQYLDCAYGAIDALKGKIPFFEVNTGAIARGYRTTPYPKKNLIKYFLESGFLPVISSDCHDKHMLDCHFAEAAALLSACGAKERYILTEHGFQAVGIRI